MLLLRSILHCDEMESCFLHLRFPVALMLRALLGSCRSFVVLGRHVGCNRASQCFSLGVFG